MEPMLLPAALSLLAWSHKRREKQALLHHDAIVRVVNVERHNLLLRRQRKCDFEHVGRVGVL